MNYEKELRKALLADDRIIVEKVFEEIYEEYQGLIKYVISKYVHNELDVEEIMNDVFYNFYKSIFKIDMYNIKYYLVQSAKHLTINHIKKKQIDLIYDEEFILNKVSSQNTFYSEIINELEKKLTEYEINVIVLHDIYNYSFQELSNKYKKSYNSIKSTYHRAIKKFNARRNTNVFK